MVPTCVSVVIPAYNEEHSVARVVQQIAAVLSDARIEHEVLVVDDGSTDNTAQAAEETVATVVRHTSNRGYGAALKTVFVSRSMTSFVSLTPMELIRHINFPTCLQRLSMPTWLSVPGLAVLWLFRLFVDLRNGF